MKKNDMILSTAAGFGVLWVLMGVGFAIAIFVGWIMNLFDVAGVVSTGNIDVEGALHIVGIIVIPLGALMGIFF